MFNRFLDGFVTFSPFFYKANNEIKYYPDDIYVNDWKIVGKMIANIIRNRDKTDNIKEEE